MAYWLMRSEPDAYSWQRLVQEKGTEWDGVRNSTARIHLRAMKVGDLAFFYHSNEQKAAVGVMRITREGRPDGDDGKWVSVAVEPVKELAKPVELKTIKAEPRLASLEMLRQSRLSVSPVREEEWKVMLELAGTKL
jgi:predicted RNA-binding protein with PUA-like domain